jgi:hypothetical protein
MAGFADPWLSEHFRLASCLLTEQEEQEGGCSPSIPAVIRRRDLRKLNEWFLGNEQANK